MRGKKKSWRGLMGKNTLFRRDTKMMIVTKKIVYCDKQTYIFILTLLSGMFLSYICLNFLICRIRIAGRLHKLFHE